MKKQRSTADRGAKWTTPFNQGIAHAGDDGYEGSGLVRSAFDAQRASFQLVLDWIDRAIADMALPPAAQPFTALDLGSSEGRNALIVMDCVAESVRRRQPEQRVQTIYSDLLSNNFNRQE
jgi:hypothetical protein